LAIAGGVTAGDVEGGRYLFRHQVDQFACGRGAAEEPDRCGAMPAAVERARERDPARYFQTLGDRNAGIDGPPGVRDSTAARG
jgi:hypothetical protein